MLLWNLFLRNNEVILYDSVQVVTFSFCMWPFTAVCVCVSDNQWQMKGKKKLHSWPLQWGKHGSGTVWSSSAGFLSTQSSQWFSNCGWPWEEKKTETTPNQWFLQKTNKKSPVILFHYSAVYNWNLSLYLHLTLSLASFTTAMNPHWSPFLFLLPRSTIFIILCPTDLLLSPLNVSKPSHPQLSTFSVRAVPLLHSFL